MQRTFSIIKPDAVRAGHTVGILQMIQDAGFEIVGIKRLSLTNEQAAGFYAVHAARPFFNSLCEFMASGPMVALVLQKADQLVQRYRVSGVPTFVINGKYTADVASAQGPERLLSLVSDLAAQEHKH